MPTTNVSAPAPSAAESPVVDNNESPVEEQVADPAAAPAAKLEKQLKKYKLKVDGEESEEELDLSDDEAVRKHLQLSKASQKRMAEAANERKSRQDFEKMAEEFISMLKRDPKAILSDPSIGIDLKKFASEIMNEQLEEEKKSPEQKEKEKLQKELEDLRNKAKKDDEDRKSKEFQRLQDEAFQRIDSDITEALKTENLPKKPYVLKKFADLMMTALENNIDISAKDVAPLVRKQIIEDIQELTGAAPDDVIEELLGKDIINRMRKRSLAKAKSPIQSATSVKSTTDSVKPSESNDKKRITMRDFLKGK